MYRHFRAMPAEDFLVYVAEDLAEAAKEKSSWFLLWGDPDALKPFCVLATEGALIVFADALTDFADEEVAVSLTRFENGSWHATDVDPLPSCLAEEEDGPRIRSSSRRHPR